MKNLDRIISEVKKYNAGIFNDIRGNFNTQIELNITPIEEYQKWADVYCNLEDFGIYESQNLTDDEETEILDLLEYIQQQIRNSEEFFRELKKTEYSLTKK